MTILTSVRLRNWRGIGDVTFKPLEQGLTGVSGANGAGKSTIQEGVLWALFGVTPDDAKKEDLRRNKSSLRDECSVSVVLVNKGQTIEVIRQLSGKNHTTTMYIYVDGREQTHTTPTVANQWIIDRLGMDAEGFLTAHVVKQKQLDSLMDARAAERRSLIEKFFGIEKMSEALKLARAEANDAKKVAAALPGTQEDVDNADLRVAQAVEAVEAERSNVGYIEQTLTRAEEDFNKAEAVLSQIITAQTAYNNAQMSVERADHAVQVASEKIKSIQERLDDARQRAAGGDAESLNRLTKEAEQLTASLAEARAKQEEYRSAKTTAEAKVSNLKERVTQLERNHERLIFERDSLAGKIDSLPQVDNKDYSSQVATFDSRLLDLNANVLDFRGRLERLNKSIATLREHEDSANCPTCHSHLDDPSELIAAFQSEINDLENRIKESTNEISQVQEEKSSVEQKVTQQQQALAQRDKLTDELNRAEQVIQDSAKEVKTTTDALSDAEKDLAKLIKGFDLDETKHEISSLEERLSEVRVDLSRQSEAREAAANVVRFESQLQEVKSQLQEAEYAASLAEEHLASLVLPTDSEIAQAEEMVSQKKAVVNDKREALSTARGDLRAAMAKVEAAEENLASQKNLLKQKTTALAQAEEKTAVAEVLDEFRRDRISRIAPELSEATTSLISSVTDGYYTEVNLDENFTPTLVKANGDMVPAQWLSGGEKSVVSLALRVAIGDIMTGGNAGLLWLDEVLVSQDAERRQAMMAAIRDLDRQVIVVNHTQGADDLVDTLVTVVKDDENGSYLEAA